MHATKALARLLTLVSLFVLAMTFSGSLNAQQVKIGATDIGGVVTGSGGPEAGVWVIAETTDTPTKFARIVVTNDQGQYLIPDLPVGNYSVWVRGYGLVDSPKLRAKPGMQLNHAAVMAPNAAAAAHYYPAIYWYTMMKIPAASEFGGKGDIPEKLTQSDWLKQMNNVDCIGCHQLGQESTRTIPAQFGTFASGEEAWTRRIQSGQAGENMINRIAGQWGGVPFKYLGDWTDRIAKGELPKTKPERPQGIERNVVVTSWEWSSPDKYMHDLISSDRRNPTVNAYGPLYGSPEYSTDNMPILDPKTNKVSFFKMPVADTEMPVSLGPGHAGAVEPLQPSAYWGDRKLWDTRANNHNSMLDQKGRVWLAASVRGMDNPAWCKKGSDNEYAKVMPLDKSQRQAAMLDPKTMKYSFIDTCFATHHPQFGYDADNTLWFSGSGPVAGWVNTRVFDETGDAKKAQGWAPWVLDTNGNGKLDDFVNPGQPADAAKDTRITAGSGPYSVMPHPTDGSIWYAIGTFAGQPGFLRFDPKTKLSEVYYIPKPGFGIRGGDIGKDGVLWGSGSSGHLMSFDRRKCKAPLNGPNATGNHCPEGWAFYKYPGPGFDGFPDTSAEASYYTWVDHHNTVGLGENVPISTANLSDGFVALVNGKMVSLRIPYPMSFYAKGLDGRIDDPNAGWKGRGLWSTNGDRTPWLMETGKGSSPRAVHIQVRPDPLAN
ncbi:MAG TPA: carboxypeptidase-like regulatory domain-containing protein [Pseudolabrys sp.]